MKKIALLFMIVCAGALNGMEPMKAERISDLPEDVHNEIIKKALASGDTLSEVMQTVNVASALRGMRYNNLKDFTKLVHILAANTFDTQTDMVAWHLKNFAPDMTEIANQYITLTHNLTDAIETRNINAADLSIQQGADVNYSFFCEEYGYTIALISAVRNKDKAMVKLLLDAGANPHFKDRYRKTALDYAQANASQEIIKLLEDAMKNKANVSST